MTIHDLILWTIDNEVPWNTELKVETYDSGTSYMLDVTRLIKYTKYVEISCD